MDLGTEFGLQFNIPLHEVFPAFKYSLILPPFIHKWLKLMTPL